MRILTNRDFSDGSVEWIDFTDGWFTWGGEDETCGVSFGVPVPQTFVADKFAECGRRFDANKLPQPAKWLGAMFAV